MSEQSEAATDRGWSRDSGERRARRPRQEIDAEQHSGGGGLVITPAWLYECPECGAQRRFATEEPKTFYGCDGCGERVFFEALGELIYP